MDPITLSPLAIVGIVIVSLFLGAFLENRYLRSTDDDYEEAAREAERLRESASRADKRNRF